MVRVNGVEVEFTADQILAGVKSGNAQRAEIASKLAEMEQVIKTVSAEMEGYKASSREMKRIADFSLFVSVVSAAIAITSVILSFVVH